MKRIGSMRYRLMIIFAFLTVSTSLFMFSIWPRDSLQKKWAGKVTLTILDIIWLVKLWHHHDNSGDYVKFNFISIFTLSESNIWYENVYCGESRFRYLVCLFIYLLVYFERLTILIYLFERWLYSYYSSYSDAIIQSCSRYQLFLTFIVEKLSNTTAKLLKSQCVGCRNF